jgi:hypothetical protein
MDGSCGMFVLRLGVGVLIIHHCWSIWVFFVLASVRQSFCLLCLCSNILHYVFVVNVPSVARPKFTTWSKGYCMWPFSITFPPFVAIRILGMWRMKISTVSLLNSLFDPVFLCLGCLHEPCGMWVLHAKSLLSITMSI